MEQQPRGLSHKQQNGCRAALNKFIDRHELSDWELTIEVKEAAPEKCSVKIEITPPHRSGLPPWPIHEIAVTDRSFDLGAEVDRLLEDAYQTCRPEVSAR